MRLTRTTNIGAVMSSSGIFMKPRSSRAPSRTPRRRRRARRRRKSDRWRRAGERRHRERSHRPADDGCIRVSAVWSVPLLTVVRSTSSRSRRPNASIARAASTRERWNRGRPPWTRLRNGWNSDRTRSVDSATGTVSPPVRSASSACRPKHCAREDRDEDRRHDGVAERPTEDPVDVVEVVSQDREGRRCGSSARLGDAEESIQLVTPRSRTADPPPRR